MASADDLLNLQVNSALAKRLKAAFREVAFENFGSLEETTRAQQALMQKMRDEWDSDELLAAFLAYEHRISSDSADTNLPGGVCNLQNQPINVFNEFILPRVHFGNVLNRCSEGRRALAPTAENGGLPGPDIVANEEAWTAFVDSIEQDADVERGVRKSRCLSLMLASVLADGMGHFTEFDNWNKHAKPLVDMPEFPIGQFCLQPGQFTDDSSMALCLLDNLLSSFNKLKKATNSPANVVSDESKSEPSSTSASSLSSASSSSSSSLLSRFEFDAIDCMLRFQCWNMFGYNNAFGFDPDRAKTFFGSDDSIGLGGNINQSMQQFWRDGRGFTTAGDANTCGNGTVMRLAPLHIAFHSDPFVIMRVAEQQSLVTHQGVQAAECCKLLAYLISALIRRPKSCERSLRQLLDSILPEFASAHHVSPSSSVHYLALSQAEYGGSDPNKDWNWRDANFRYAPARIRAQGGYVGAYVMDAAAMALHICYYSHSLSHALLWNSATGGDADSVGTVIGQILGAFYGLKALPYNWVAQIFRWDGQPSGTIVRRTLRLFDLANSN